MYILVVISGRVHLRNVLYAADQVSCKQQTGNMIDSGRGAIKFTSWDSCTFVGQDHLSHRLCDPAQPCVSSLITEDLYFHIPLPRHFTTLIHKRRGASIIFLSCCAHRSASQNRVVSGWSSGHIAAFASDVEGCPHSLIKMCWKVAKTYLI